MRVVLDTNTVVSALLFSGVASRLVPMWQSRRITVLLSKAILAEYLRVLAYPKFRLGEQEVRALIDGELLPFVEPIRVGRRRLTVTIRDPDDAKFLACAVAGGAEYLVTGDADLAQVGAYRDIVILSAGDFVRRLES